MSAVKGKKQSKGGKTENQSPAAAVKTDVLTDALNYKPAIADTQQPSSSDTASGEVVEERATSADAVADEGDKPASPLDAAVAAALEAHKKALSIPPPARSGKANVSRSTVQNPVKLVHKISAEMHAADPNVSRKAVIAACEQVGIATHTAKTQYQVWRTAARNDAAAAARTLPTTPVAVSRTEPKLATLRPKA